MAAAAIQDVPTERECVHQRLAAGQVTAEIAASAVNEMI
jgi:hypothetical protein